MPDFVGRDGLFGGVNLVGGIVWRPPPEPSEFIEERGFESDRVRRGGDELVRVRGEPDWGVRGRRRIHEDMSSVEKRRVGAASMTKEERLNI